MNLLELLDQDPNLREATKQTYRSALKRYRASYGDRISKASVQLWLNSLGCGSRTKSAYLAALKYADRQLAIFGRHKIQLAGEPKISLGSNPGNERPPRALSKQEIRDLLDSCSGKSGYDKRDRALLGLGLTMGMRHGALWRLNRDDLFKTGKRWQARIQLKGGGEHLAPISAEALELVQPWLRWQGAVEGPLFQELSGGNRLGYRSIGAVVFRRGLQASIFDLKVHDLRHTMVTQARLAGWTTLEIAAVTGHVTDLEGSSRVIDRVYTDLGLASREWARGSDRLT
jgi:integrase